MKQTHKSREPDRQKPECPIRAFLHHHIFDLSTKDIV